MATNYPINPRVRAFGKARIDIARRAKNQTQWEKLWKHPANSFPFVWDESWKQCVEYRVNDFPAEVGFYIDILGLPINALDSGYAMFTSPQGEFFFSIVPTPHTEHSTPPDAFRLQFLVKDIIATTHELQRRGIEFEQTPQPLQPGSSLSIASFRTPHGICVELWGKVEAGISPETEPGLSKGQNYEDEEQDDGEDEFEEDEDNTDEAEENGELITGQNGEEDEGGLDGEDESDEDPEDDDLGEDLEGDADEGDFEFEEDEDDFDDDQDDDDDEFDRNEDVTSMTSGPRKSIIPNPTMLHKDAKLKSPNKITGILNKESPEYIDLDAF